MKRSARTSKKASPRTQRVHLLHREIPTLNAFVIIFYILIFILGVSIFITR